MHDIFWCIFVGITFSLQVVLSEEHAAEWISNSSFADVNHVLSESTVEDFDVYPVDKKGVFSL